MSVSGRFEITITTNTQEEMDRIAEAIFNGYAENVLKERILWSQYAPQSAPSNSSSRAKAPRQELKRLDSKVAPVAPTPAPEPVKTERSKGVMGRSRLGRSKQ